MDVAFEVIDADEWLIKAEGESFGVGDADEQCSGQAGSFGYGHGVEVAERDGTACGSGRAGHGFANDEDDVAEMLARGEFWDDTAVVGME